MGRSLVTASLLNTGKFSMLAQHCSQTMRHLWIFRIIQSIWLCLIQLMHPQRLLHDFSHAKLKPHLMVFDKRSHLVLPPPPTFFFIYILSNEASVGLPTTIVKEDSCSFLTLAVSRDAYRRFDALDARHSFFGWLKEYCLRILFLSGISCRSSWVPRDSFPPDCFPPYPIRIFRLNVMCTRQRFLLKIPSLKISSLKIPSETCCTIDRSAPDSPRNV